MVSIKPNLIPGFPRILAHPVPARAIRRRHTRRGWCKGLKLRVYSIQDTMVGRRAVGLALLSLLLSPAANAFAPSPLSTMQFSRAAVSAGGRLRPAVRKGVSMSMESVEGVQFLLSAVENVPFVDELTGAPQGFTAPVNHFLSVIGLWVRYSERSRS
jgi:hypothetical protein